MSYISTTIFLRTFASYFFTSIYFSGSKKCQNFDAEFRSSPTGRHFSTYHLRRELTNGTNVERDWIVYSPSKQSIFCFACRLFGDHNRTENEIYGKIGFNDWKNSARSIKLHEHSKNHQDNYLAFRRRVKQLNTIDCSFKRSEETEMEYWRQVLYRIVSVIKFLGSRGLAFRGNDQKIGSKQNGNFLGILELISEYDPLLKRHLSQYGNKGKGRASYLSANTCNEFILLIARKMENKIIAEVQKAKYYSISVDSTPDVSHTDQLVFCIRYVKNQAPVERFLNFIPIEEHTAEYMADIVTVFLTDKHIDIMDCRGQSYDNASNMSGCYSGLQARISDINNKAIFVPCAAHSLNLVGQNAVDGNKKANAFFDLIESLYHFFVYSTFRWEKLKIALSDKGEFLLKRATGTRWSAKNNAIVAIDTSYGKILGVLKSLLVNNNLQTEVNKANATGFINKLCTFENILMLKIWRKVLNQFQRVNLTLQKSDLNLSVTVKLYRFLILFLEKFDEQYDSIFGEALILFEEVQIHRIETVSTRSTSDRKSPEEEKQKHRDTLFQPIVQSLLTNVKTRGDVYCHLEEQFSFLANLDKLSYDEIVESCKKVASFYSNDLDENELIEECQIAKEYFSFDSSTFSHASMYSILVNDGLMCTMPNIEILLQMYLCMFVTNVCDERSFSKLKYVKNYLRNSLGQERLSAFALFSIENDILESLSFDDIIDEFISLKNRKKVIASSSSASSAQYDYDN